MASPTFPEIITQMNRCILMLDEADKWNRSNTDNVAGLYDAFLQNGTAGLEGDFVNQAVAGVDSFRARSAGLVTEDVGRAMLDPFIREIAKVKGYPEIDPGDILDRLFIEMDGDSTDVNSRAYTYGSVSAGGANTGDGVLSRLTVDAYGQNIENATPEAKTLKCVSDRHTGANVHAEIFEVRGADVPRDFVAGVVGPDRVGTITAMRAEDSQRLIQNPTFNQYTGTAPDIDSITGWTVTTAIANFQIETSTVYKTATLEGDSPGAVRFETNDKLTQALTVQGGTILTNTPYYAQIAYNRADGSGDGTLTLRVGSNSVAVTLSAQTGWNVLRLSLDTNLFHRNFNATTLDVEIEISSRTTGTTIVDELILAPMTYWDGIWHALVGGATPFLREDSHSWTDSETGAIVQTWFWRLYNRYLPHVNDGTETWPDP